MDSDFYVCFLHHLLQQFFHKPYKRMYYYMDVSYSNSY